MNHKLRFDEDKAELEAHFAERVRAYVELGETPEQAALSAQEKFGETETVMRELRWQHRRRSFRSPIAGGLIFAAGFLLITALCKHIGLHHQDWADWLFTLTYSLYLWQATRKSRCVRAGR